MAEPVKPGNTRRAHRERGRRHPERGEANRLTEFGDEARIGLFAVDNCTVLLRETLKHEPRIRPEHVLAGLLECGRRQELDPELARLGPRVENARELT
ncbi:Uncharacterised protein [Mycobacterium tuberculosis]|nr:Uncharacterised protein [Mycobacterium tuberculosis]